MKTLKILLFSAFITLSIFTGSQVFAAPKVKLCKEALSNYVQYVVINGELWKYTYSDDGQLLQTERVFD